MQTIQTMQTMYNMSAKSNSRMYRNPEICSKNEIERLQMNLLGQKETGKVNQKISYFRWQPNSGTLF